VDYRKLDDTFEISLYTDGSKMDCGVGARVYSPDLEVEKTLHLPGSTSGLQADPFAIMQLEGGILL